MSSRFDQLEKASFRGVAFHVASHESTGGRRVASFEFPGRDRPYNEDLGRRAESYSIEAYVVGDDWRARRDALRAACAAAGAGELVHPFYGRVKVVCTEIKTREETNAVGFAKLALTFKEDGPAAEPTQSADTRAAVAEAADEARDAVVEDFEESWDTDGASHIGDAAAEDIGLTGGEFGNVFGADGLADFDLGRALADFSPAGASGAASWIRDGAMVASRVVAIYDAANLAFKTVVSVPLVIKGAIMAAIHLPATIRSALARDMAANKALLRQIAFRNLFDFSLKRTDAPAPTPSLIQAAQNAAALEELVTRLAVVAAAEAASAAIVEEDVARRIDTPLAVPTVEAALEMRDAVADAIERKAESASDPVHQALSALRVAFVSDVARRAVDLPRLARFEPAATLPALVIAHRLHGDASREAEIVRMNRVRHPGFVPGGRSLAVLADG